MDSAKMKNWRVAIVIVSFLILFAFHFYVYGKRSVLLKDLVIGRCAPQDAYQALRTTIR